MTDENELHALLDTLNGVLLTGGQLTLINTETNEQHPYYTTAAKILDYSVKLKDEHDISFPVLGICQGFQLFTMYAAGHKNVLKDVISLNEKRKVEWALEKPQLSTMLFSEFDDELVEHMAT